jgi:hypothetical protein
MTKIIDPSDEIRQVAVSVKKEQEQSELAKQRQLENLKGMCAEFTEYTEGEVLVRVEQVAKGTILDSPTMPAAFTVTVSTPFTELDVPTMHGTGAYNEMVAYITGLAHMIQVLSAMSGGYDAESSPSAPDPDPV